MGFVDYIYLITSSPGQMIFLKSLASSIPRLDAASISIRSIAAR